MSKGVQIDSSQSIHSPKGDISMITEKSAINIYRSTNHTEISIMEDDWEEINLKVEKIQLKRAIDLSSILIGTMIPCAIECFCDYFKKEDPNITPLVICCVLWIFCKYLSKYIPFIRKDNTETNLVHLEDIKRILKKINEKQPSKKD